MIVEANIEVIRDESFDNVGLFICFEVQNHLLPAKDQTMRTLKAARLLARLSQREQQVMSMIFDGLTNKAIASACRISIKTVEKDRSKIMSKAEVSNFAALMRLACYASLLDAAKWAHRIDYSTAR